MADEPKDPKPSKDSVVLPFRKRWRGKGGPPRTEAQTLADGTVVEKMGRGWALWNFAPYPIQQSTCVGCLDKRREEHPACGHEECDCFCMVGKSWPLWALLGLGPPEDQPVPPQLSGVAGQEPVEKDASAGAQLNAKLDSANTSLDKANKKLDSTRRALWVLAASVAALALVSCLRLQGLSQQSVPGSFTRLLGLSETPEMGERPVDMPVPKEPLPGAKRMPCDAEGGEIGINGGCYVITVIKPPCGRKLFRSGDSCYRAIAADPDKPMSLFR